MRRSRRYAGESVYRYSSVSETLPREVAEDRLYRDELTYSTPEYASRVFSPAVMPAGVARQGLRGRMRPLFFPAKQILLGARTARVGASPDKLRLNARVHACLVRKARREVLFALGSSGRSGVGRGKHWRRTPESQFSCRR